MRLLLVDDSDLIRLALSSVLRLKGHAVDCARNIDEATTRLASDVYDAVFVDLNLGPECGLALAPVIRAACDDTKLILMSGQELPEEHVAEVKPDRVHRKGAGVETLHECLLSACAG